MKTTNAFKQYNRNKFYNSIFVKTVELGFAPKYLPNEKDRTNFGNKLDWENKTKEVESLLNSNGLQVLLTDYSGEPIYNSYVYPTREKAKELPVGVSPKYVVKKEKIYKTKRILKSKNDVSLYTNIKNWYEANNKFDDFRRIKRKIVNPKVYEIIEYFFTDLYLNLTILSNKNIANIIESTVELNVDVFSKKYKIYSTLSELDLYVYVRSTKECVINGGIPPTNNFAYFLLGGDPNTSNPMTLEEWCRVNQKEFY